LTYFASDIGDTLKCRSCGAALAVSAEGLSVVPGRANVPANPGGSSVSTAPRPASTPQTEQIPPGLAKALWYLDWLNWTLGWLYVPGLFFVLLFVFLPQLDTIGQRNREEAMQDDNAPYRKAQIELDQKKDKKREEMRKREKDLEYERADLDEEDRKLRKKETTLGPKASDAEREQIEKERKAIQDRRKKLQDKAETLNDDRGALDYSVNKEVRSDADKLDKEQRDWGFKKRLMAVELQQSRVSASGRQWWWYLGRLFATIVLTLGAIGYLTPKEPPLRRIVGVVTIGAIILLVASQLNGGHSVLFGFLLLVPPRWPGREVPMAPPGRTTSIR
jgi:hypothetical protein